MDWGRTRTCAIPSTTILLFLLDRPRRAQGVLNLGYTLSDLVAFAFPRFFQESQTMSKSIHVPKWVCAVAILLSVAALIAQAVIDVRQSTMGMSLFSDRWFAQAWQIGLITPFIIVTVAIAAQYLAAGAYVRS